MRARMKAPGWSVLWVLLGLGLLLRVYTMIAYTPTVFNYYGGDSTRLMRLDFTGITGLFGDDAQPAGYPLFLAALREISSWLPLTTIVQHGLGLATAVLLYAAVVRVGAPRWAGLIPAAVVLFSGDQIFLEHGILTEALWMPLLALGMYLMARSLSSTEHADWWLAAGGAALACSALARNVSEVLIPLLAVWAAVALAGRPWVRLRHAAAVLLTAVAVIGAYLVVSMPIAGGHSGLVEYGGVQIYGRTAQFADCRQFTPPVGGEALCMTTPPDARPGPFFWTFSDASPLRAQLMWDGHDPHVIGIIRQFGWSAVLNQPGDYARAVTKDLARFFAPGIGTSRADSGTDPQQMSFASTVPTAQGASLEELAAQFQQIYSGVGTGIAPESARTTLGDYQSTFRVHGLLAFLLICLAAAGTVLGRGTLRMGAAMFLVSGLALLIFPPLVWSYDVRYATPPMNLLAAGAGIGLAALAARSRERSTRPPPERAIGV